MPHPTTILDMFGRSPIRPLQQHMEKAHAGVALLEPFFQATLASDWEKATDQQAKIDALENEADDIKKDLRIHLPRGLFLPVPRGDLLELLAQQEQLADVAKDISGIVLGRKMHIPSVLSVPFMAFLARSIEASAQAMKSIDELDKLLESGFRGKEADIVDHLIQALHPIESATDSMQVELRQTLFGIEKTLAPVDVMFLYQIIRWIGLIANVAQNVGDRLQMLLVK
ncbi:MAG: TIGR00153 family protein [Gammaproteobacteria bacterium RIFCSPHIGHO2_12_FULL_41_15]|nr:MAG: TIGR00153 family protein [Gammaproteobacteria bacterium RIFCSPHIGHO2_12_FULL_41_15]